MKDTNTIEIQEEVSIPQDGKKIILEKGDKIQILKEDETLTWREFKNRTLLHKTLSDFYLEALNEKIRLNGSSAKVELAIGRLKITTLASRSSLLITPEDSDIVTVYEDIDYGFKIQLNALGAVFQGFY